MSGFERDLMKELRAAGCEVLRHGKGSHVIWETPDGRSVSVPAKVKSRHLMTRIIKQAMGVEKCQR